MIRNIFLPLAALFMAAAAPDATPDALTSADAVKLVGAKGDEVHATPTVWNGVPTIFVDYVTGSEDEAERPLFAVQRTGGSLRAVKITVGEQEGGTPVIAAIGFANADHDSRKELIVILRWPVVHYDVEGILYEVRLFDDLKPGRSTLTPLVRFGRHFGGECECSWRDGRRRRFRFKTLAAVRRELSRLGY